MPMINYIEALEEKIVPEEIVRKIQLLVDSIKNFSPECFFNLYHNDKSQVDKLIEDIINKLNLSIGWLKQNENPPITNLKILEVTYLQLWVVIRSVFELRFNTRELSNKKFTLLDNMGSILSLTFDDDGRIEDKNIKAESAKEQNFKDQKKRLEEKLKKYIEKSHFPEESYFINFLISIYHTDKLKDFNHYRIMRNNHPLTHRNIDSPIEKFELSEIDFDKIIDLITGLLIIKKI